MSKKAPNKILYHKVYYLTVGLFKITFEDSGLENVNIKFRGCTNLTKEQMSWVSKHRQDLIKTMFSELRGAKILALDLVTLQVIFL